MRCFGTLRRKTAAQRLNMTGNYGSKVSLRGEKGAF